MVSGLSLFFIIIVCLIVNCQGSIFLELYFLIIRTFISTSISYKLFIYGFEAVHEHYSTHVWIIILFYPHFLEIFPNLAPSPFDVLCMNPDYWISVVFLMMYSLMCVFYMIFQPNVSTPTIRMNCCATQNILLYSTYQSSLCSILYWHIKTFAFINHSSKFHLKSVDFQSAFGDCVSYGQISLHFHHFIYASHFDRVITPVLLNRHPKSFQKPHYCILV